MPKVTREREMRWPHVVAARVDDATLAEIEAAARARGELPSAILRRLVEIGLGRVDKLDPVRRRRSPVRDAEQLATALALLRTCAGNLQRLYVAHSAAGVSDSELLTAKHEVRNVAARLRSVLGDGGTNP